MKVGCATCFTYKYISSSKVREKYCCKYCKENNWVYYRPDLLDVKQFLKSVENEVAYDNN